MIAQDGEQRMCKVIDTKQIFGITSASTPSTSSETEASHTTAETSSSKAASAQKAG